MKTIVIRKRKVLVLLCASFSIFSVTASQPLKNEQSANNNSVTKPIPLPSRDQELPTPANGNCLYHAAMIGYLLPAVEDEPLFTRRLTNLVGKDQVAVSKKQEEETKEDSDDEKEDDEGLWEVPKLLKDFRKLRRANLVAALRGDPFAMLISDMRLHMRIRNRGWGGTQEMKTIAKKLQVTIQEYTPDPENKKILIQLGTISPPKAKPLQTLRIVRDNPTQEESVDAAQDWKMQRAQQLSAEEAQHRQHYRALLSNMPSCLQNKGFQSSLNADTPSDWGIQDEEMDDDLLHATQIETISFDKLKLKAEDFKGMPYPYQKEALLMGENNDRREKIDALPLLFPSTTEKVDVTRFIVQLYMTFESGEGAGTGTIIDRRKGRFFILTAAHNLQTEEMEEVTHLFFAFAGNSRKYPCPSYFIYPTYNAQEKRGLDIGLVVSSPCRFKLPAPFPPLASPSQGNYQGYVVGYPGEKKKGTLWGMKGALQVKLSEVKISYPIDTTKGQSGAPILGKVNERYALIGVHTDGGSYYNHGFPLTSAIRKWIDAPSSFSTTNPTKNNLHLPFHETHYEEHHLIERKNKLHQIKATFGKLPQANQKSKIVVLTAWGGAGKTILSELYAHHTWQKTYQHVWRLHMESRETCQNSIREVTERLGILQECKSQLDDGIRWRFLKRMLEKHSGWLLILDNAKTPQEVQKFVALYGGHILITTRDTNKYWEEKVGGKQVHVGKLTPQESQDLLFSFHKPTQEAEKKNAQELANTLGHLPLALAQAGYYLQAQKESNTAQLKAAPYQNYLLQYQKRTKIFTQAQNKKGKKSDPHFKKVYNTFMISLTQIEQEQGAPEAIRILRVMSYFNPDGVDLTFFHHLRPSRKGFINKVKALVQSKETTIPEEAAAEGWTLLRQYGMVGQDEERFKTHRLIQEIMRDQIAAQKDKKDQAVQLLEVMYNLHHPSKTEQPATPEQSKKKSKRHLQATRLSRATQINMISHIYSVMSYLTEEPKLRTRLLYLLSHLRHSDILQSDLYLPPQATNRRALHAQVTRFIYKSNTPLLLLTGDAGSGKSAYATYLVQEIWEDYRTFYFGTTYLPILVILPQTCQLCLQEAESKKQTPDLIATALARQGVQDDAIEEMRTAVEKGKSHLLLVLDSYDEINANLNAEKKNLYTQYGLKRWMSRYTKIVVTCRTAYLQDQPKQELFKIGNIKPEELTIAPFSSDQIDGYIEEFADSPYNLQESWHAKRYQKALAQFPSLKAMMERPFILVIGLTTLPQLMEKKNKKISLYDLYEAFTAQWLQREADKPHHRGAASEKVFKKQIRTFCEKLAFAMFEQGKNLLQKQDKKLEKFLQNPTTFQSAPLRQVAPNTYQFIQPSYRDFFAAPLIITQKRLKNYIGKKVLNDELVGFLTQAIPKNQDDQLAPRLFSYVEKARQEQGIGIEAGYCLQLLYHMDKKSLHHKDYSGIDLEGGNLTGIDCTGVNFTKAHLKKSNFTQTKLKDVRLPKDLSNCNLTGVQLPQDMSAYNLKGANLSQTNLKEVRLPKDLTEVVLHRADLTGHQFTDTNLTDAQLEGAILNATTCDYQAHFQANVKTNKLSGGKWYLENLLKDLKSIAQVYPKLKENADKADLLPIACGLSRLPYYEYTEFYIKVSYWSCKLLRLKKKLDTPYGNQLVCSLESNLEYDAERYCWRTEYPQDQVTCTQVNPLLTQEKPNFTSYLKRFQDGLKRYKCKSENQKYGFKYYKDNIEKNIQGLGKAYPKLKSKTLEKEAIQIADALSKSYEIQQLPFLLHYLFYQNRLIRLKNTAGVGVKNDIHYSPIGISLFPTFTAGVGVKNDIHYSILSKIP